MPVLISNDERDGCEICHNEAAFIRNLDDQRWYGIECAARAGNIDAIKLRAHRKVMEFVDRALAPAQEVEAIQ